MTKSWQRWIAVVALLSYTGCSKAPSEQKPSTPTASTAPAATEAPLITGQTVTALTPASEVVALFLENLKKGDAVQTRALLTDAARARIDAIGMSIDPLGSADSKFTVGRTQYSDKESDAAFVEAEWSEPVEDKMVSSEVVFTVHKENNAWRISGMVLETGTAGETVFVDFENMPAMDPAAGAAQGTQTAATTPSKATSVAPAGSSIPPQTAQAPSYVAPTQQAAQAPVPQGGYSVPPQAVQAAPQGNYSLPPQQVAQPLNTGKNSLR